MLVQPYGCSRKLSSPASRARPLGYVSDLAGTDKDWIRIAPKDHAENVTPFGYAICRSLLGHKLPSERLCDTDQSHMITRNTLRSQAKEIVLKRILSRDLAPGEAINLSELASELEISRTPLREALLSLVEQGLVGLGEANKGFFVWPLTLTEARNLGEINQTLEALAVRSTKQADPEHLENLRAINHKLERVQGQPEQMIKWDDQWHLTLISATENDELRRMVLRVRNRFYRYRRYAYDYAAIHKSDAKRQSVHQHAACIDALEADDIPRAADLLEEHWKIGLDLLFEWLPETEELRIPQT